MQVAVTYSVLAIYSGTSIYNGYDIEGLYYSLFDHVPYHFRNNKSAFAHSNFVESAITEIISSGSVVECLSAPLVVNPLSVSIQSSGKKRLILDLTYLNSIIIEPKLP